MMYKLAVFSGLIISVSCMVLRQSPLPVTLGIQYHDTPNYNFAYEVNDAHTGDIKSQHESRRGDTVLGQYSLLQPDGLRRTVDYRADEHAGFRATVNNEASQIQNEVNDRQTQRPSVWSTEAPTPAPTVAISRSSIVQTFSSPVRAVTPVHTPVHAPVFAPIQEPVQQYNQQYNSNPWQ